MGRAGVGSGRPWALRAIGGRGGQGEAVGMAGHRRPWARGGGAPGESSASPGVEWIEPSPRGVSGGVGHCRGVERVELEEREEPYERPVERGVSGPSQPAG